MMKERLLQRVNELIEKGNEVLATRHRNDVSDNQGWITDVFGQRHEHRHSGPEWVDDGKMRGFRTASLSFIQRTYNENHPHYTEFLKSAAGSTSQDVKNGLGILEAIRDEIAGGWLFTIKNLVTAEVFTDYIDMAEYLLKEGYKDAAAVIAGSTVEERLRQLCRNNGIPTARQKDGKETPLTADTLNSELAKAEVYSKLDQKQVTAWLDLRNKAAHGKYNEYNADQVEGMIRGVTEFMARVAV